MDFSMHIIKHIFQFACISAILAGCNGGGRQTRWHSEYDNGPVSAPAILQYGTFASDLYGSSDDDKNIAVLLPTSGVNTSVGKTIRPGIEAAAMRFAPTGLNIRFYDTGTGNVPETIQSALNDNPSIIIGPVFADNAKILRDIKSSSIPALAFTSDFSAVGNGVISVALMPTNTIETTIQSMKSNGANRFITIAPNTTSGRTMAGAAYTIGDIYNIVNNGVFYYNEHDTESIKSAAMAASMYTARHAANTRAKEILSGIINHENLSYSEKSSLSKQLEKINRTDTLGNLPYDSILFLGGGDDTKSLASFLRYYGVGVRDVAFYGTPLWEGTDIASDITMTGAMFATMPDISTDFADIYTNATGGNANRMAAMGYDATILAIGAMYGNRDIPSYIMSPSGYVGANGLFRLRSNGANERALQVMRLNGDGTTTVVKNPQTNFSIPIYTSAVNYISPISEMPLSSGGVNPMNYINIPERFRGKYTSKTYGANYSNALPRPTEMPTVTIISNSDDVSVTSEDYQPVPLENVSRTYIDSVEISE